MGNKQDVLASLGGIDAQAYLSGERTISLQEGIAHTKHCIETLDAPTLRLESNAGPVLLTGDEKERLSLYAKGLLYERLGSLEHAATPRFSVTSWADGPCFDVDAWVPEEASKLVDLLREGRVADPLRAATAWLVARTVSRGFETGDDRPAAVMIFEKQLWEAGAGEFVDVQKAANDAHGFLIKNA